MNRRAAIIVFGTLLCSMGGYVAWCWRPFYLKPRLEIDASVSSEGRTAVETWRKSATYPRHARFTWSHAWWNLVHPWEIRMSLPVRIHEISGTLRARQTSNVSSKSIYSHDRVLGNHLMTLDQKALASRMEEWVDSGATIEIISLGRPSIDERGTAVDEKGVEMFHGFPVLGRVAVPGGPEGRDLFESFTRSIGEAGTREEAEMGMPHHGVVFTVGERKRKFVISFESGYMHAFDAGPDGLDGATGNRKKNPYFMMTSHALGSFNEFLDRNGVVRDGQADRDVK